MRGGCPLRLSDIDDRKQRECSRVRRLRSFAHTRPGNKKHNGSHQLRSCTGSSMATLLSDISRWRLIAGAAAIMFVGQISLILLGSWLLGTAPVRENPSANHSVEFQLIVTVIALPFVETLVGRWLPIRLLTSWLRQPWWLAWAISAIVFTGLHGYTDRAALTILLGAMVLSTVFVIEAMKRGRPVLTAPISLMHWPTL